MGGRGLGTSGPRDLGRESAVSILALSPPHSRSRGLSWGSDKVLQKPAPRAKMMRKGAAWQNGGA